MFCNYCDVYHFIQNNLCKTYINDNKIDIVDSIQIDKH
jgi:hypothetical protein